MQDFILGTSALPTASIPLIQSAGIQWIRQEFTFPFRDKLRGQLTDTYKQNKAQAQAWKNAGLNVMGITPLPGLGGWKPGPDGNLKLTWQSWTPDWFGTPGSPEYLRNYRELCAFLARDLKGLAPLWQVANELDIELFAGPLDLRQACDLLTAGAQGLKSADPSLIVGPNSVYFEKSYYLYGRLFTTPGHPFDYCGVDSYFGSWRSGGPRDWDVCLRELPKITGMKIIVNEFGFASRGSVMTPEEKQKMDAGAPACQFRKWPFGWREGHSEQLQADYMREVFNVLKTHREHLLGAFLYRWEDQEKCWQCGREDCPCEIAWGIVDKNNQPKPAYHAFRDGLKNLLQSA
jgi:hypothetical protein